MGGRPYVLINPKTSTIGGTTNGSSVRNSTNGLARGSRRRTQNAVGTRRATLTAIVMNPTTKEYPRVDHTRGSSRNPVKPAVGGRALTEKTNVPNRGRKK